MRPTSTPDIAAPSVRWHFTAPTRAFVLVALATAVLPFTGALMQLFDVWNLRPEYSHGILIPLVSLFLVWRQRHTLATTPFHGSWLGLFVVAGGLSLWLIGEFSTIDTIVQYGFLLVLYGLVVALIGWQVFRRLWMPFLILVFAIPLPAFMSSTLSLKLQLLSSALGVALIRLAGISVFLEGNVIDLGTYQLQVAEACDGLRYLFPLMTLAFIVSHFFRAPPWKRVLLFVCSVPIAILMNSLRIGVIGVTVEYWGSRMAEGLLHDFEGWVVFMVSTAALLGVAVVLARLGGAKGGLRDVLVFDLASRAAQPADSSSEQRPLPRSFAAAAALAATSAIVGFALPDRAELHPARTEFAEFPAQVGTWQGRRQALEKIYLDTLKLDDYIMADYRRADSPPVNFYVAYYDSQRKGRSVHSPRSCIPGGGWVIRSLEERSLTNGGRTLQVNRAVIELGRERQVVYYWFQQRGRDITNEYLVKWYIFWDALTRNRTDGALVRLTAPLRPGMDETRADAAIAQFAAAVVPGLHSYIPE
jgi:exosortase D (VPLPA-CTERM-specific)